MPEENKFIIEITEELKKLGYVVLDKKILIMIYKKLLTYMDAQTDNELPKEDITDYELLELIFNLIR